MVMNILICVKPVRSSIVYTQEDRVEEYTINPYDLLCLNKILDIKNQYNFHITVIAMGILGVKQVLTKCLAMGVDEAILLSDKEAFAGSDTVATVNVLAAAFQRINYDYIVMGAKSIDGETGQVKYGLAEKLHLECIENVIEILHIDAQNIKLEIDTSESTNIIKASGPLIISYRDFTFVNGKVNLLRLKQANRKSITVWDCKDLNLDQNLCGMNGSKTKVVKLIPIEKQNNCVCIDDKIDKANFIANLINNYNGGNTVE